MPQHPHQHDNNNCLSIQEVVPVAVTLRNLCMPRPRRPRTRSHYQYNPVLDLSHGGGGSSSSRRRVVRGGATVTHHSCLSQQHVRMEMEMEMLVPRSLVLELKQQSCRKDCMEFQKRVSFLLSWNHDNDRSHGQGQGHVSRRRSRQSDSASSSSSAASHSGGLVRLCLARTSWPSFHSVNEYCDHDIRHDDKKDQQGENRGYNMNLFVRPLMGTQSHPIWDHFNETLDDLHDFLICHHGDNCRCGVGRGANSSFMDLVNSDDDQSILPTERCDDDDENDNNNYHDDDENESHGMMESIWKKIVSAAIIQCRAVLVDDDHDDDDDGNDREKNRNGIQDHHHSDFDTHDAAALNIHVVNNHSAADDTDRDESNTGADANVKRSNFVLASVPLHYKEMIALPVVPTEMFLNSMQRDETPVLGISKYANAIPQSLPRNTLLVHYSDGTTRVLPELYRFLVESGVIPQEQEKERDTKGKSTSITWEKYEKRFDDEVFQVLKDDSVHETTMSTTTEGTSKALQGINNNNSRETCVKLTLHHNGTRSSMEASSTGKSNGTLVRGSFADAFQSLSLGQSVASRNRLGSGTKNESDDGQSHSNDVDSAVGCMEWSGHSSNVSHGERKENGEVPTLYHGHDVRLLALASTSASASCVEDSTTIIRRIQSLDEEIEKLQEIFILEENALKKEQEMQQMNVQKLKDFTDMVATIDAERRGIEEEASMIEKQSILEQNLVQGRRRKLLEELRHKIYPIQTGDVFTICGIPIPKEMHTLSASDETISAGLGFVCLVVIMCSKYLSIPLRYRLIFNSSMSVVKEDFEVYPLFKERVVEKEQFDRGVVLLNRNIDHLLEMQGLSVTEDITRTHILAKMDLLLKHIES